MRNEYVARDFRDTPIARLRTTVTKRRPWRPQTNGKVERYHRILLEEWAYIRAWNSEPQRTAGYAHFIHFYNDHRPHGGLGWATPTSTLTDNLPGGTHLGAGEEIELPLDDVLRVAVEGPRLGWFNPHERPVSYLREHVAVRGFATGEVDGREHAVGVELVDVVQRGEEVGTGQIR